jgi:hypothetical protein
MSVRLTFLHAAMARLKREPIPAKPKMVAPAQIPSDRLVANVRSSPGRGNGVEVATGIDDSMSIPEKVTRGGLPNI